MGKRTLSRGGFRYLRALVTGGCLCGCGRYPAVRIRSRPMRVVPEVPPRSPPLFAISVAKPLPPEKAAKVDELRAEIARRAAASKATQIPRPSKKQRAPFKKMTDDDRALCLALANVTFPVASSAKRFAREISNEARNPFALITEKQRGFVHTLITRYRRQIEPSSVPEHLRQLLVKPKKSKPPKHEERE
jgi:hypothetical protein